MYKSLEDAQTAFVNGGVVFEGFNSDTIIYWMFQENATPEQAARYFGVI